MEERLLFFPCTCPASIGPPDTNTVGRFRRAAAGEAAGYLQGEENIARVEQADHDKIRIYAKKGADVREEVFRQMAEHNVPVLEMKTVTKSLEDVFLEITQEGGAQ